MGISLHLKHLQSLLSLMVQSPNRRVQGMWHSTPIFITDITKRCNVQIQNQYTYTTSSDREVSLGMRLLEAGVHKNGRLEYSSHCSYALLLEAIQWNLSETRTLG